MEEYVGARRLMEKSGVWSPRHRPTMFTGHYPDLHDVTQNDGLGRTADDPRSFESRSAIT